MSLCIQGASRALTTNQPAVCGTPPSTRASAMAARLLAFVTLWVMDVEQQLTELWASIDQLDEEEFRARVDRVAARLPEADAAFERACALDSTRP
jgi:hypothetical protein